MPDFENRAPTHERQSLERAFDPDVFNGQAREMINLLASYLGSLSPGNSVPVLPETNPNKLLAFWQQDFRTDNRSVEDRTRDIITQSLHLHHPRNLGHQVAPVLPLAAVTELLSGLLNNGMAVYETGPVSSVMEKIVADWACKKLGYPDTANGFLTSGGTLGNLTALLAARQKMAGYDAWKEGNFNRQPLAVLVSAEAHYCVERAAKIMGLGEQGVVKIASGEGFAMDMNALETDYEDITQKGFKVIAVVGSACTTSTGSYDPIEKIADFCKQKECWFHVDGAHGGAVMLSDKYRHWVKGMEKADSVVIDYHKMLLTSALTTAVLFKNGDDSYQSFAQKAQYLSEENDPRWYDLYIRSIECTKKMMSTKVYLLLTTYGEEFFIRYIDKMYDMARSFAAFIHSQPDFDLLMDPQSNIVCFRYHPDTANANLSRLNEKLRRKVVESGRYYIVQTRVKGETWLRTTLMNPLTRQQDLEGVLGEIRSQALER